MKNLVLALAISLSAVSAVPVAAQSSKAVVAGERTISIAIPAGYQDLASVSADWVQQLFGFVAEDEVPLLVIVADAVSAETPDWTSTTAYAIVSAIKHSLGGTTSTPDFVGQIDFAVNGLRDVSPLTEADAAALLQQALASAETPPRFDPASPLAIEGVQVLAVTESGEDSAAITILHPTPDAALVVNDLGFINLNGQLLKVACFAVLQDATTVATLQGLGKAIRDGTLAAN